MHSWGLKLGYLALITTALLIWPKMDEMHLIGAFERWPREGTWTFASHFATWDSAHYLRLSELGYAKDVRSCAFYRSGPC